uniref:Origin recognition complex subunit 5 n=1 Tax=Salmo trutta TaxID=8032 RepID=A0A674CCV1_SALTR
MNNCSAMERLPCRDVQASMLLALMGEPEQCSYPSILIYGHRATGKSHVMHTLLKELELPYATVSCVECVFVGLLFEQVLLSLFGSDSASLLSRSPSLSDFVRVYKQLCVQASAKQTRYIVLDRAELLRDMEANLLPAFLRLQELVRVMLPVEHTTSLSCRQTVSDGCFFALFVTYFFTYFVHKLQQILSEDSHPSYSPELYSAFINILLGLRHLVMKEGDTHKLWGNIEPHLKKAMQTVYLREVSSVQWEQQLQMEEKEAGAVRGLSAHAHVELPYYSKFLLIAAYLASYNPARTDKRFFLKHHGKIKKTNFLKKHEKTSNHLLGPKPFPLDRLLAIFYSVVDSRVAPTASVFCQISSLVTLQLLNQVGHDDQLDAPKYKCAVPLDFILAISRTVSFDMVKYLYDFL